MRRFPVAGFCGICLALPLAAVAQSNQPMYLDSSQPAAVRAHDLVSRMTLDEKAAQLEDWATAIPRLHVPDYQTWSEALHGVANSGYATVFPQAIGMGATWDPALVKQMGDIISTEGRAKFNQAQRENNHRIFYGLTFWSPNINIFRDPRWGRGQETYGEDPYLTGRMGVAFVQGVQGDDPEHPKAVATSKHFAVHSGPESTRHIANVDVAPRDLEETYLPAFRSTVVDGHVKSVMCAYNAIDNTAACANTMLLKDHLRDAWGFKGFVVSDCAAIVDVTNGHHNAPDILHAAAISIEAGTDLSCSIWAPGFNTLADAVRKGVVKEELLTRSAERLYTARFELGLLDKPGTSAFDRIPYSDDASDAHRAVALRAAKESMVLLKNTGALPLRPAVRSIAVVGPTAALLTSLEGNYNGTSLNAVYPLDGIARQFPGAKIHYEQGATLADGFSVPVPRTVFGTGLHTEFFATPDWSGQPVASRTELDIQHDWRDAMPVPQLQTHDYSVRWTGTITPPAPGKYTFLVEGGSNFPYSPKERYQFKLDGKELSSGDFAAGKLDMGGISSTASGASPTAPPVMTATKPARIEVSFADTRPHAFSLEYSHSGDRAGGGATLRWEAPAEAQLAEAVTAAKESDVVLAFVGLSPQLEGEEMPIKIDGFNGGDRTSIALPAAQQKLLEAVAATGKPVVVVSLSGSAIAHTWAKEHAAAVLQAWYPGVEGGTAIAQTLAGVNNPAGRLPVTFYADTQDLPAFTDYSLKNRTYRYYTGTPLWGFGYGLSYASFTYGKARISAPTVEAGQPLTATVTVTNTSKLAGEEVAEAYLKTPQPDGPRHALAGFQRVALGPGESKEVSITLAPRSLSSVDNQGQRSILPGTYQLTVGGAQPAEARSKSEASFQVNGTMPLPK
ncbi:glycoside hydrolase family 3 C-terminal domain-containing protein [Acidipila sp. EB88]|uniref:glycoside hydrolase family 3 C-terminal domain-containing protein n=1 Tax=Acidipila sp. EB88 TaxID=2305226 RepID=UPI000F5DD6C2|nr:glycoside hydrolase family 3 C-terminal domain-containing protein [Acidipila sp. EB88]RRA48604.1 glycoside hydrolase family 3 protein [Acidipila sp. EB88]